MTNNTQHIPSGYKTSPLGIIPEDWEVKRLGDIAEITSGTTPSRDNSSFYSKGTIPWVKTTDLNNGVLNKTEELVTEAAIEQTSLKVLPIGTVLVAMYGGFNQIGRTALLGMDATVNQALSALVCKHEAFNHYVLAWLNCHVGDWKRLAASSRKDPNITGKDVERFPILVPKIEEQQCIVSVLSLWDTAIAKQTSLIEQLALRKRGLMQQLLTGKKRLKGFCGEWKEVRLGEICPMERGEMLTSDNYLQGNIPVIAGGKEPAGFHSYANRQKNTITISCSGASAGFVAFHDVPIFATDCFTISESNAYNVWFIYHVLTNLQEKIYKLQTGGAQPHVHPKDVYPMKIHIPSIKEQNVIASVLVNADKEIEIQKQKLAAMQEQKKGLMQVLLTGKRRVTI